MKPTIIDRTRHLLVVCEQLGVQPTSISVGIIRDSAMLPLADFRRVFAGRSVKLEILSNHTKLFIDHEGVQFDCYEPLTRPEPACLILPEAEKGLVIP